MPKPAPTTFDFDQARRNVLAFAELAGWPMTKWQARALTLKTRITVIVAPRQSGKSKSLAVKAAQWAFRKPNQQVLIVSAGEDAARRLLADVKRMIGDAPLLAGSVVDEMAGLLTLSNGSTIRSVPASERQVRGWTIDLLLIDEAALVSDDLLLGAAMPTTAARPNARIVLASSASVAAGAFYDHVRMAEAGSQHVTLHRWPLTRCEWISPSVIEAARASMSELRFRAEYEGEFASRADALFTRESLEAATRAYRPERLADLRGPARVTAGVDWGASVDRSAICAIGRIGGTRTYAIRCAHRWPAGQPLHDVIAQIANSPAHFDTLAMETNGLGMPCAQELSRMIEARPLSEGGGRPTRPVLVRAMDFEFGELRRQIERAALRRALNRSGNHRFISRRLPIHTTADMKAATYSALRLLVDRQQLLLPESAEDLLRELLMLRVDLTPGGSERIEASTGHDDLADALMLALCPYRDRKGRWTTYIGQLAQYADPDELRPEPPFRWQSVNGPERGVEPEPISPKSTDNRGERLLARIEAATKKEAWPNG